MTTDYNDLTNKERKQEMSARILHPPSNPVINYAHRNYRSVSDSHTHKLSQSN